MPHASGIEDTRFEFENGKRPRGAAPHCDDLAGQLSGRPEVESVTSEIVAASGTTPAYCQVNMQVKPVTNIRIGLPLNRPDGGLGGVNGAWNGKIEHGGGGAFSGLVGTVTTQVTDGYVGSASDNGHSAQWCSEINPKTGYPNAYPCPPFTGGGFVLDPSDNSLMKWQVKEFVTKSELKQVERTLQVAKMYYEQTPMRNYWVGCSTGGQEGLELAQKYGDQFDGFVVGDPAINLNRFPVGQLWPYIVVHQLLGPSGLSLAKANAATNAALTACDAARRRG